MSRIHFGIDQLAYFVKFDKSYYSIWQNFSKDEPELLFGASFGIWKRNSISIYSRSSLHYFDKVDLFAVRYNYWKKSDNEYIGSVDTDKQLTIRIIFDRKKDIFRIRVRDHETHSGKINFFTHFFYPLNKWGFIRKTTYDDISIEREYGRETNI